MPDEAHNGMMSPTTTGGLPFVHLSETGTVIDSLLRYIYPIDNPLNINAGFLCDVLDTAEKYDMKYITREARLLLNRRRVTEPEALLVLYRRACDQHQEDDARRYAFETLTLSHPLIVKQWGAYNLVGALSNLIEYHQAVSMAISDYIARFWSSGSGSMMWGKCRHCNNNDCPWTSTEPSWWTNNLLSRVQNICKEGPLSAPLLPSDEAMEFIKCHSCSWSVYGKWKNFEAKFSKAINEEAKQVFTSPYHDRAWTDPAFGRPSLIFLG